MTHVSFAWLFFVLLPNFQKEALAKVLVENLKQLTPVDLQILTS